MGIYLNSNDQALAKNSVSYKIMSLMTVAYLLVFPLSSTVLSYVSGATIIFIVMSSIVLYLFPLKGIRHINHEERMFYFSVSFMVLVVVLATAFSELDYQGAKKLSKFIYLLMVFPVYFYFKTIRVKQIWLWYGLSLGAIVSALVGIYEVANDSIIPRYVGRANGATHPIIFGDLALLMGVMALAGWGWFKTQSRWQIAIPVVAVCAGVMASILSQSRGGWVAVPFLVVIFAWFFAAHISKLKMLLGISLIIGLFAIAYQVPQTGMQSKVKITLKNIEKYINADEKHVAGGTSVTSRFEMWKASWDIFLKNPVLGVGVGHYRENAQALVKQGERHAMAGAFNHPHNQFLSAMVSGGIIAFIAILMLFIVPAKIFFHVCKSPDRSPDAQRVALAGLILMVGFGIFNMSESFLERSRTVTFFIFYLAVCMAGIREKGEVKK